MDSAGPEEKELCRSAAKGDLGARDQLIRRNLPLAHRLAARYRNSNQELEDLEQVAGLALVKAVDRFDPDRGPPFAAFAIPTILGELKRHFRDHAWSVRVPRDLQERRAAVSDAIETLTAEKGHPPTVGQIAGELGISLEEVLEAERVGEAFEAVSFDRPQGPEDESQAPSETFGTIEAGFDLAEYSVASETAVRQLSDRDRAILKMRFIDDMTQTEIAEKVGISQMQVSRILRDLVRILRDAVDEGLGSEEGSDG